MDLVIRKAVQNDIGPMLEIQKKAFVVQAERYKAYDMPPMTESAEDIDLSADELEVLIAEVEGNIAGSIRVVRKDETAEIKRLSVSVKYQKMGIGTKLLKEAEKLCTGLPRIWLFTGGQSTSNINLYKKLGFVPFKEDPWKDNFTLIYLEKYLDIKEY